LLVVLGCSILAVHFEKVTGNAILSLVSIVPGAFYFLNPVDQDFGNTWSFVNGMESPLSIFLLGTLFWYTYKNRIYENKKIYHFIITGMIISLIILCRLDNVFLVIGYLLCFFPARDSFKDFLKNSVIITFFSAFLVVLYLAYNYNYSGMFMPISGSVKGGNALLVNVLRLFNTIYPILTTQGILTSTGVWQSLGWRSILMTFPAIICALYILLAYTGNIVYNRDKYVILPLCIYVFLKFLYNITFVSLWGQGHWYYPLSILISSLVLCIFISGRIDDRSKPLLFDTKNYHFITKSIGLALVIVSVVLLLATSIVKTTHTMLPVLVGSALYVLGIYNENATKKSAVGLLESLVLIIVSILISNSLVFSKIENGYNEQYINIIEIRDTLSVSLKEKLSSKKVISYDDGIFAYAFGFQTLSGLGFALDKEAAAAKSSGNLLSIAHERGYKYLTSVNYMPEVEDQDDGMLFQSKPFWLSEKDLEKFNFETVFVHKKTGLKIIEFSTSTN
jgi:hypothetical protein